MAELGPIPILAVSGGPDSVYLVHWSLKNFPFPLLAHFNHGARGKDSERDQRFVVHLAEKLNVPVEVSGFPLRPVFPIRGKRSKMPAGFEDKARKERYRFLRELKEKKGSGKIFTAHTADDQVETVLMRILEGAGVSGLKGIPRKTADGIERPLLDVWRKDILACLKKRKIPYRVDKSNFDTRFERNWVRHVLIPLLEERYGKSVKKRIFVLGERFREIDDFLEAQARRWMKRNVKDDPQKGGSLVLPRRTYARLSPVVRKKIVQLLCLEGVGKSPNERLIEAIDRMMISGGPSSRLNIGKGRVLKCRYDDAEISTGRERSARPSAMSMSKRLGSHIRWEEKGRMAPRDLRGLAQGERGAAFDAGGVSLPLAVRPLRTGDRIRPFGHNGGKKVKEVLIDRKVPRDERWGRPVVCDATGEILWIPGVVRSAHAPVTSRTRRTIVLHAEFPDRQGP